jgi:hypothetical protein
MTTIDKTYSRMLRGCADAKTGDELADMAEALNKYAYLRNLRPGGAVKMSKEGKCLSYGWFRFAWRWIKYTARVRYSRAGRAALAADKVAANRFVAEIREGRAGLASTPGTIERFNEVSHGL